MLLQTGFMNYENSTELGRDLETGSTKTMAQTLVRQRSHLAHGDTIGSCSSTKEPTVTVEPPTPCISTENGLIGYARFPLSGLPLGKVLIMDSQFSEPLQELEVQAETYSMPVGFSTGEKTAADANRNLQEDAGEISATKTFTITC